MTPPTQQELEVVFDEFSKLFIKLYPNDKPNPSLDDYGRVFFINQKIFINALKFTIATNEPSDSLIDLMRRYENREFNHTPSEAFKAMTAKIWEGIEN